MASAVSRGVTTNAENAAAAAARALCRVGRGTRFPDDRAETIAHAVALRTLAPLVRRAIPLPVLLLAHAGERPPPELAAPPGALTPSQLQLLRLARADDGAAP